MDVRAPFYSSYDDGELYEAKILKLFDDQFVLIEYYGML